MQVEELFDLTNWISEEIEQEELLQKYQRLQKILQQNTQPNQQKIPFDEQKEQLVASLARVPLSGLSNGQLEILGVIGIGNNVGEMGVSRVEDTLYRNALDVANAAQIMAKSVQDLTRGIQWSQQVRTSLATIINEEPVSEMKDGVLLRVHFTRDAHLSNLTEFKDWGKTWWEIGRGIGMAHNTAPEGISIVGASKGSVIISLLATYAIAKTTGLIIHEALKVAEKIYAIQKQREEVRALQLANNAAEKALEDAEKLEKKQGVEHIINVAVDQIGLDKKQEGDKVNELSSAIRKLVDFIEKGGEVDFVIPEEA